MMDKLIDQMMTKLFQVAEYICNMYLFAEHKPTTEVPQTTSIPTIHFTNEDKDVNKREQARPKVKIAEGNCFK